MKKEFLKRDSATAYLRKNSIPKDIYNNFILQVDGKFIVDCDAVVKFNSHDKPAKIPKSIKSSAPIEQKTEQSTSKTTEPKNHNDSVTSVCRKLILEKKTNQEIWDIIKVVFNLDADKRHYPAWHRSNMRRKGLIK